MNSDAAVLAATRSARWAWRVGLILIALFGCLGPYSNRLLEAMVPVQRITVGALMPDFDLHRFGLVQRGAHLTLSVTLVNRRYLVMAGRAHPPGIGFDADTPARTALLYPCLILIGLALTWPASASRRMRWLANAFALAAALVMALMAQPLVLAGQVWGLGLSATDEPTVAAGLVAASEFLLHGGGYALCAALLWSITRVGAGPTRA